MYMFINVIYYVHVHQMILYSSNLEVYTSTVTQHSVKVWQSVKSSTHNILVKVWCYAHCSSTHAMHLQKAIYVSTTCNTYYCC